MDRDSENRGRFRSRLVVSALFLFVLADAAAAGDMGLTVAGGNWCGTQRVHDEKYRQRYGTTATPGPCGEAHPCDDPPVRDTWIPDGNEEIQQVRMIIHVLALDDGSNPFSTPDHVAGQVAQLNADFAQVGIEFVYQVNQINSTAWRSLAENEITAMKQATAIEPDRYLNVWVTIVEFSYSFGTFPWSFDALEATGGIVMGHFHWVDLPNRAFAHEVGHTLGLYHTFHGVDEVDPCDLCYEIPSSNSSDVGDLCADTPPTPTNSGPCTDYGGADPCSGEPWGHTMPENYMGYASQTCLDTFTPQQRGRLRCWSNTALDAWVIPFQVEASPTLGPVPMTVDFTAATHKSATAWHWTFGDGASSEQQSPSNTYLAPGLKGVAVDMETASGTYFRDFPGLIAAYADTLRFAPARFEGNVGRVEVYTRNYLPLSQIEVPVVYDGPVDIRLDSVSTIGLRSESIGASIIGLAINLKKATFLVGGSATSLAPGAGAVATLFFTLLQPGANGTIPVDTTSTSRESLTFVTAAGEYVPVVESGFIVASCCQGTVGDANADRQPNATIGDLSMLVSHLFVTGITLDCYQEADINQSGGVDATSADITIGDISTLVDHLYLSGVDLADCL